MPGFLRQRLHFVPAFSVSVQVGVHSIRSNVPLAAAEMSSGHKPGKKRMVRISRVAQARSMTPALRICTALLIASVLGVQAPPCALASDEGVSLYEIVVQTSMPHLEENLRYTKTTAKRCLTRSELLVAFPILTEGAFNECGLAQQALSDSHASYRLICPASTGTTGIAVWRFSASHFAGTLEVKLGGKNMTFHQRVTAKRVGECVSARE